VNTKSRIRTQALPWPSADATKIARQQNNLKIKIGFRTLDVDGDGEITVDEFVKGYMKLKKNSSLAGKAISMKRRVKVKQAIHPPRT